MGCWNETCMVSNLPILCGDLCCGALIVPTGKDTRSSYSDVLYKPVTPLFTGVYNDYGMLEDVALLEQPIETDADRLATALLSTGQIYLSAKEFRREQLLGLYSPAKGGLEQLLSCAERQRLYYKERPDALPQAVSLVMIRKEFYDLARKQNASALKEAKKIMKKGAALCKDRSDTNSAGWKSYVSSSHKPHLLLAALLDQGIDLSSLVVFDSFLAEHRRQWVPPTGRGSQLEVGKRSRALYKTISRAMNDLFISDGD